MGVLMGCVATGYSDYQVYLMLSCAPIQGHVGGLVDVSLPPFFSPKHPD